MNNENKQTMNNEEKLSSIPENIQVEELNNSLTITYKWNKNVGYALLGFSLVWNSILHFGFISEMLSENIPTFVLFLLAPFIAIGIFVPYFSIANILNKTIINVSFDNVTIKHTPLPWVGNRDISKHDIKQIYVKEHDDISKRRTNITYSVNLIDKYNKNVNLVENLYAPDQAKFIEQKIEEFLKIQSKSVSGEYNG